MKDNIIKKLSFNFAVRVVNLNKYLCLHKSEFVLSMQLFRSGTSVGAMIREAEHAESKIDLKHKMSIAQKEINETIYWLALLKETEYLSKEEFQSLEKDAVEIIKLITAIIKSLNLIFWMRSSFCFIYH